MASRLAQIRNRRNSLVARSRALRAQLILEAGALRYELGLRQIGRTLANTARRHRGVLIGAVIALIALRLQRIRKLAALGGRSLGFVWRGAPLMATALRLVGTFAARGNANRGRASMRS